MSLTWSIWKPSLRWVVSVLCFITVFVECVEEKQEAAQEYGVVVDAGSSGSRIRVYKWPQRASHLQVPAIREVFNHRVKPGVSDFVDKLSELAPYVTSLLTEAKQHVPASHQYATPIYFMATAGM